MWVVYLLTCYSFMIGPCYLHVHVSVYVSLFSCILVHPHMCMCLCVQACLHEFLWTHTCVCACEGEWSNSGVIPWASLTLFERGSLPGTWNWPQACWMARVLQRSPCICLISTGVINTCHYALFSTRFLGWISGSPLGFPQPQAFPSLHPCPTSFPKQGELTSRERLINRQKHST